MSEQKGRRISGESPGTFRGKKISEIDIWKKPGQKDRYEYSGMRLAPHPDPTANEAIANVMKAEREKRKRRLMKAIEDNRECRRIIAEKKRDERRHPQAPENTEGCGSGEDDDA